MSYSNKWKVIRNCAPRKESTQPAYSRDLKTLADKFNAFFSSVGAKAAADSASLLANSDFNDISSSFPAQQLFPDSEQSQFRAVSMQEFRKIVMPFSSHKALGCDKVPMQIIVALYSSHTYRHCEPFFSLVCIPMGLEDIRNYSSTQRRGSRGGE